MKIGTRGYIEISKMKFNDKFDSNDALRTITKLNMLRWIYIYKVIVTWRTVIQYQNTIRHVSLDVSSVTALSLYYNTPLSPCPQRS